MRISTQEMIQKLRSAVDRAGSLRAWARKHRVSAAYVSDVLRGRRHAGPSILKHIPGGFVRRTRTFVDYIQGPDDA